MNWQSARTAPKDGTRILVAKRDGHICIAEWKISHWIRNETNKRVDFTHWMPLPEPPSRKKRTFRVLLGNELNKRPDQNHL